MKNKIVFSCMVVIIILSVLGIVDAGKGGGGVVPISTISLNEQGNNYNMTPGRLIFEFNGEWYAIQLRRVKDEYAGFIVLDLDENNLEDITAYILGDSFNLTARGKKEIDINKDGANDISIELINLMRTGKHNSIRSANFSIKKIKNEKLTLNEFGKETVNSTEMENKDIIEPMLEPVFVVKQEQPTFLEKIVNWFRGLFI